MSLTWNEKGKVIQKILMNYKKILLVMFSFWYFI